MCGSVSVIAVAADGFPANTQRDNHVIITSKRRFDVKITCLLRFVFAVLTPDSDTSLDNVRDTFLSLYSYKWLSIRAKLVAISFKWPIWSWGVIVAPKELIGREWTE